MQTPLYLASLCISEGRQAGSHAAEQACIALLRPAAGSESPYINHSSGSVKFNFTSPFILR